MKGCACRISTFPNYESEGTLEAFALRGSVVAAPTERIIPTVSTRRTPVDRMLGYTVIHRPDNNVTSSAAGAITIPVYGKSNRGVFTFPSNTSGACLKVQTKQQSVRVLVRKRWFGFGESWGHSDICIRGPSPAPQ